MSFKNKTIVITIAIIIISLNGYAQMVPPPIPPPPPPGLPIDGGLIYLLIGGLIYGVKKIISKNKF
ncbi:PID-CTERM protein-sorting domain-containing protein [Polaribacter uvawellassae]|uniref:PID-CTERM protein-sorting domain-containing protein n=1 Tax=Polaribacter uvawellassae TaxID=3133495 RepID=UPI00321B4016